MSEQNTKGKQGAWASGGNVRAGIVRRAAILPACLQLMEWGLEAMYMRKGVREGHVVTGASIAEAPA